MKHTFDEIAVWFVANVLFIFGAVGGGVIKIIHKPPESPTRAIGVLVVAVGFAAIFAPPITYLLEKYIPVDFGPQVGAAISAILAIGSHNFVEAFLHGSSKAPAIVSDALDEVASKFKGKDNDNATS